MPKKKKKQRRKIRTADEKIAIVEEREDRIRRGLKLQPLYNRHKVHASQVAGWAKQVTEGTIYEKSKRANGRSREPYRKPPTPKSKSGTGAQLVQPLQTALKQRDIYRDALEKLQGIFEDALRRAA